MVEAVLTEQTTAGPALDRSQVAIVRSLATSGCRVQVALAPAGAGKTAALGVLARVWEASGGTVLGLAPTAVAAEELGRATGVFADTLAKYLHETTTGAGHACLDQAGGANGRVGPRTLVLVDEAGWPRPVSWLPWCGASSTRGAVCGWSGTTSSSAPGPSLAGHRS